MNHEDVLREAEAELQRSEAFIERHRAKVRAGMKTLRDLRKRAGLCISCGKPRHGYIRCQSCRAKIARRNQALRRSA